MVRPYRRLLALAFAAAAVASLLDTATVVFLDPLLKQLFGQGLLSGGESALESLIPRLLSPIVGNGSATSVTLRLVLLFLVVLVGKIIATYVSAYTAVLIQEGVAKDLRTRLWKHLLRLDLNVFQRTRGGQLATGLVSDTDQVKLVVVASLATLFQNSVLTLSMLAAMVLLSWRLTVIVLVLAPALVLAVQLLRSRLRTHARMFTFERGELTALITERLGAMKLIRAFGTETVEVERFSRQAGRYRKGIVRTQRFALLTSPASELFGGAMIMLVIWAAATPEISGVELSISSTLVFVILAARLMSPIKAIAEVPTKLAMAEASGERVFEFLDMPATEVDPPDSKEARFDRSLEFDGVTFGYNPERPVLRDVSFSVAKGEVVALVGPSGAGKTTLLELVPRFYDPQGGEVRLDGVPLRELSRSSLRQLTAVVSQDTVLLHDTVHANIAYGKPDATSAEVEASARAANAHEFIMGLPDRYQTKLGERGTRLSGGQRQRVAIARALLRDAPILILDEATSALDTESERLVQEAIDRLVKDRTVLVIAHRLATVRDAHRILVLDDGRLVEQGVHADLHAQGGLYRRLHDLQFSVAEVTR